MGGVRCPASTGLPWGSIDSGTLTVASSPNLAVFTTASLNPAAGYKLSTNDPATFALRLDTLTGTYYGLSVKRTGLYVLQVNMSLITNHAIAHGTVRAAIQIVGGGGGGSSTAYGLSPIPYVNVGTQGGGIDASPQVWDLYQTIMIDYTATSALPSEPYTFELSQECGFNASGLPAVMMTRISDVISGGIV